MSDMSDRLRTARENAGFKSKAAAARALSVGESTYRGHENGQNQFDADFANLYARKFNVRAGWLLTGEEPIGELPHSRQPTIADLPKPEQMPAGNASPAVSVSYPTQKIPMLGTVAGGFDGRFALNGNKIMDVLCPPQLVGVPDAYGVFVHGNSMEPRYFAGEAVFVNPHLPVRQNDFVVVQIAGVDESDDVSGYVKRFVSFTHRELILEQYQQREDVPDDAPEGERYLLKFARERVYAVHKIVASGIA